ncbi:MULTISPECIES: hypothetical protein [unclassified Sinorhizobium]|uniref:hypothetical protein n=1 Tax=unclassified Sinorhizobium TaxID=2613772 RepID=UPI003523E65B
MTALLFTADGCLTAVPHANDSVPSELRALGEAIGKWGIEDSRMAYQRDHARVRPISYPEDLR